MTSTVNRARAATSPKAIASKLAVVLVLSFGCAAVAACGSSSGSDLAASGGVSVGGGANGPGASDGGANDPGSSDGGASTVGSAGSADPGVEPNPGAAPPGTPCGGEGDNPSGTAMPELCASGRCETMPGTVGPVCLGACFAEGAPCTRALDCCSTGCFGGFCSDALCILENETCSEDAECCSGICAEGECQVDEPNRECRPTGEDCSGGTGSGCCHACVEEGDRFFDFFDGEQRCGFAPETCFAQGVACGDDSDCCRGVCRDGFCRTTCSEDGAECQADSDCCSSACDTAAGTCGDPGEPGCVRIAGQCLENADCCSGFCFGGFCEVAIR